MGPAQQQLVCGAFFGSLKKERLRSAPWPTSREAPSAIFEWSSAGTTAPAVLDARVPLTENYEQLILELERSRRKPPGP
jgi:hypothetical protein